MCPTEVGSNPYIVAVESQFQHLKQPIMYAKGREELSGLKYLQNLGWWAAKGADQVGVKVMCAELIKYVG